MELSLCPSLIEAVVCRPEEDGAFLFNPETGTVTYINWTALEVYRLIDGEKDIGAIIGIFEERYSDIAGEQLQTDITTILESFDENEFITIR